MHANLPVMFMMLFPLFLWWQCPPTGTNCINSMFCFLFAVVKVTSLMTRLSFEHVVCHGNHLIKT